MNENSPNVIGSNKGFTLIEVIIALAIVSISVLAVISAMNKHTEVAAGLEKRILASWVASNQMALVRHDARISKIKTGASSEIVTMGGHKWRARSNVKRTDIDRVFKITITVKDEANRDEGDFATLVSAISDQ